MNRFFTKYWRGLKTLFSFFPIFAHANVLVITHSYNRPDFIEIQHRTFQKFLRDDFQFVVFNDAASEEMKSKIEDVCARLGIRCICIPQEIHAAPYLAREPNDDYQNPAVRCANVVQYCLIYWVLHIKGLLPLSMQICF